jgi:8-oxo-dGTP diphosphatase
MVIEFRVDLVLLCLRPSALQVLLEEGERGTRGPWRLPGSPLAEGLSLEENARACLRSATGRHHAYLEQLYTYGEPDRVSGKRTVSCAYLVLLRSGQPDLAQGFSGAWHEAASPPPLAHDHADILDYALTRLRYKLEYSAVGFELLPETFTLPELQRAYEAVLGEPLDKRNFRRRILGASVIEPAPGFRSSDGRPARLYRYRDDAVAEVKARRLFP